MPTKYWRLLRRQIQFLFFFKSHVFFVRRGFFQVATGSKSSYYAMKLGPLSSISLLFALELNSEPSSEEMDEELERNDIANLYFVSLTLQIATTKIFWW